MRARTWSFLAGVTVLFAVAMTGHTGAAAESTSADFTSSEELNAVVATVSGEIAQEFSETATWAGQYFTGEELVVAVAGQPPESMLRELETLSDATGLPITVERVDHSMADLDAVVTRILGDQDVIAKAGIVIVDWGIDARANAVNIGVSEPTERSVAWLQARYADSQAAQGQTSAIVVQQMDGASSSASRGDDEAPWTGGARTYSEDYDTSNGAYVNICTSGFEAVNNSTGNHYNVTAGHCFRTSGVEVFDGGTDHFGTVTHKKYSTFDGASVHTEPGHDDVWSDPTSVVRDITGSSTTDTPGVNVCYDGATTKESCGASILGNYCVNYASQSPGGPPAASICNLIKTSGNHATGGDSGGPVYTTTGSTKANATGIISGSGHSGSTYYNYYTPVWIITSEWDLTIRCGTCS